MARSDLTLSLAFQNSKFRWFEVFELSYYVIELLNMFMGINFGLTFERSSYQVGSMSSDVFDDPQIKSWAWTQGRVVYQVKPSLKLLPSHNQSKIRIRHYIILGLTRSQQIANQHQMTGYSSWGIWKWNSRQAVPGLGANSVDCRGNREDFYSNHYRLKTKSWSDVHIFQK